MDLFGAEQIKLREKGVLAINSVIGAVLMKIPGSK
jgi:hypothetical protein